MTEQLNANDLEYARSVVKGYFKEVADSRSKRAAVNLYDIANQAAWRDMHEAGVIKDLGTGNFEYLGDVFRLMPGNGDCEEWLVWVGRSEVI